MGIRTSEGNARYPDISVFCGNSLSKDRDKDQVAEDPVAIFEVLSPPSTGRQDQGEKLDEYRLLPTLDTIVCVDPAGELTRVVQRLGPSSWRDDLFAVPHDVEVPRLGVIIPHDAIFLRD